MGIQPSAYSAMCANKVGPAAPPMRIGGRGCCRGLGHDQLSSKRTNSPSKPACSWLHSCCIASTCSRARARRLRKSTPWLAISSRFQPKPMPKTKRPLAMRSSVATALAVTDRITLRHQTDARAECDARGHGGGRRQGHERIDACACIPPPTSRRRSAAVSAGWSECACAPGSTTRRSRALPRRGPARPDRCSGR